MKHKANKSILLADDDEDDCLLFEDALREVSSSTELTMANDGVELIKLMEASVPPSPDVIFLDLNMPKRNGFECLEMIRKTKKWKDIPIVIFSTSSQEETVRRVYEHGANYFLKKPGSFLKLKQAISHILNIDWSKIKKVNVSGGFKYIY